MKPSLPAGSPPTPDFLPTLAEIARYFTGAARLMAGHRDGLDRLDLSADGFWRSFAAILVALPPSILSWVEFERVERGGMPAQAGEATLAFAHALADLTAWLLPILLLATVARHIGFSRRIVPFVVATNWGGALLTWAFSPFFLVVMLAGPGDGTQLLGLLMGAVSIFLTVRLVASSTESDVPFSIAVVTMMVIASILSYGAVSDLLGVRLV